MKASARVTADKRVVNLTRSAYMGQQRYATITWSGDVAATWETLRRQIAEGSQLLRDRIAVLDGGHRRRSLSSASPISGSGSGDYDLGVDDLGYRELYVRWFQFGAFLPMFRSHGTDTPREIWRFGEPGEPMYDALVKIPAPALPAAALHLLAGRLDHAADYTMLRALAFDFRADPATYDIRDQFMFGPAFLVNPGHAADVLRRRIDAVGGCQQDPLRLSACRLRLVRFLDRPALRRAARPFRRTRRSINCRCTCAPDRSCRWCQAMQYVDELPDAPVELHIYPGRDGSFLLYEDEGDGYNYEQGAFSTIDIRWEDAARRLVLDATRRALSRHARAARVSDGAARRRTG